MLAIASLPDSFPLGTTTFAHCPVRNLQVMVRLIARECGTLNVWGTFSCGQRFELAAAVVHGQGLTLQGSPPVGPTN